MSTSTFSYAQAAKGQLPAQSVTSQQSSNHSQTPSVTGNPNRDTNTTNVSTRDPSVAISASSHDIDSSRSARSTSVKPDDSQLNGTEITQDETNTVTSVTESVSSTKTGADQPSVDDGFKGTETRGRSTNTSSDASEQDEGKKGRKSKKSKSAEKGTEAGEEVEKAALPAKVELSEAPLPSVNIWVQRQREQAAKAKAIDQSTSSSISSAQIGTDSKTRPSHSESGEGSKISTNGKQGPKRDGESSRNNNNHGPKRTAPRGARTQDKELDTNFVATNPASWPTPETAAVNLKTQPQAQSEKLEKEDKEDSKTVKPKQKNEWVKMQNFVPSVKFETPINRGPRTGARTGAPRGGRDTTGNHQSAVSSNDRAQEPNAGPRTSSGPKRAPIEGSGQREGRKNNNSHMEHSKSQKEPTSEITNRDQHKPSQYGLVNGTTQEPSGQAPMSSQQTGENVKNSDSYKDIRTQTHKEHHTQNQNGSNHRGNERGRGAGRGRGGFSLNANGMSHYAQNPYVAQHHTYQFPSGNPRHGNHYSASYQPVSYSYSAQSGPGQRKPTNGNRRQGGGRVPAMAPMNIPYDPTIYHAHNGGIFPYESGNLLQLAQQQVEYYFSVNNIVKDLFLRRHMDSQGFVPISVIASFNRMKELLVDLNILRQACIDSVLLELVMGNDGVERVRSKEGWDKWVLKDMSERHPSARHEGPASWQPFSNGFQHPMMSPQYPVETPPMFSPTSEHGFAHYPNGNYGPPMSMAAVNGSIAYTRPQESQLSAAVPEFSPSNTSTFNGVKSPSVNGGEDKKAVAHAEVNGVPPSHEQPHSLTNGTILGQPQALVDNSHLANGVGLAH